MVAGLRLAPEQALQPRLATTAVQLQLAQARLQVGSGTQLDLQRAEVADGQQRVNALNARNQAAIEIVRLFQNMGMVPVMGTVLDPTMALRELNADSHAELVRKEPGLSKLPPTIAAALADVGARPEDLDKARARFAKALALLKLLHQAGVPIVAGTDQTVPGHSIYRELELYVQAGFTPLEALQAATLIPARVMNRDKELGTIEVGKRADFVVVDGDPLADIRALRRVGLVVAGGTAYDPARLWQSVGFKP